jgi:Flp pilus assembly protein TadG
VSIPARVLGCRRGAAAIEFAFILPTFFLLFLLIIETGWQMAVAAGVDQGARRGARWVTLGAAAPDGMTRMDRLTEIILTSSGLPLQASRLTVTTTAFPNFAALATPDAGVPGLGGPDQVVRYIVEYRSILLTPVARLAPLSEMLTYRSVFVVQNEPFPG